MHRLNNSNKYLFIIIQCVLLLSLLLSLLVVNANLVRYKLQMFIKNNSCDFPFEIKSQNMLETMLDIAHPRASILASECNTFLWYDKHWISHEKTIWHEISKPCEMVFTWNPWYSWYFMWKPHILDMLGLGISCSACNCHCVLDFWFCIIGPIQLRLSFKQLWSIWYKAADHWTSR